MPKQDILPGDRVHILGYEHEGVYEGTVIKNVPTSGGCLVRPDNSNIAGGFGYNELNFLPRRRTLWAWLIAEEGSM